MESNQKTYQLKQGEKEYKLTTSLLEDLINITCKSKTGQSYTRIFTMEEFKSLDKAFFRFNSAYEALEYLDIYLGSQKLQVKEEIGGFKIILFLNSNGLIHQIEIPLGDNISNNNSAYETFKEQYPTTYLTQNQNYNNYQNLTEQYSTPIYSNNSFNATTNEYITADNNNDLTNQYIETGNNNFSSGLEQDNSQEINYSLPLPSFDSDQFLNNYNSSNEYIQNYSTTSVEIPIEPNPTLPIVSYPEITTNDQFTNDLTSNNQFGTEDFNTNQLNYEYTSSNNQFTSENINQFFKGDITNQYLTEDYNQYFTEQPGLNNNYNENKIFRNNTISRSLTIPQIKNNLDGYFNQTTRRTITKSRNITQPQSLKLINHNNSNLTPRLALTLPKIENESDPTLSKVEKIPNRSLDLNVLHSQQQQHRSSIENNIYTSLPIKTIEQKNADSKNVRFNLTLFQSNQEDDRINKLEGDANSLKNDYQLLENKINSLSNELNSYNSHIGSIGRESRRKEIDKLRAENKAIKQQLSELNNLRHKAAELDSLKAQLAQLDPLRKKAAEMEILKSQLRDFNDLKSRLAELNKLKSQLDEVDHLRARVSNMNTLQDKLSELHFLRVKTADAENLKKKYQQMENERIKYENEIQHLRSSQKMELLKLRDSLESEQQQQQLSYEGSISERTKNIIVRGDIIENMYELEMITRQINKYSPKITLNLLYKATVDSDKASAFHEKCDQAESSLVLIKTDKGKRFGGFTSCSWGGDCIDKIDEEAFIFSLDKMMIYENIPGEDAIGCYPTFGPTFLGCQIKIYDDAFIRGGTTFLRGLNYDTEEDYELTGGDRFFGVKEIEVYEVIFH